ncbi:MAG TPA: ACP S-malonyltransferase [Anaerolineales bacterium]|nr:ACP S-malonyltransferase [Anaerolineales bacterium]
MPPDPLHTAFLFPGQGSQKVGMGKELSEADASARAVFAEADDILGFPLSRFCWQGPAEELNETDVTQPALLTHSVAVLRALQARRPGWVPGAVAGHSLGEFSALVAAGALEFAAALRLVRERGRLMKEAGRRQPGGMAAILGLDVEAVESVCRAVEAETGRTVQVANDNCPGQIVISGDEAALATALERLSAAGAKRAIRLAVSIAAHSALMAPALESFAGAVDGAAIVDPRLPVVGNVGAAPLRTAVEIRADVKAQLTARVRWTESVRRMIGDGVQAFAEVGTGDVLIGLIRRIDRSPALMALDAPATLDAFLV